jgi:DNA-binding MarR family transcriptional regulator
VLLTVAHRIEAALGAALAPLGLTVSRLGLLGHISGVPGVSFSDLARMSGISVQSVHTASSIELTPEGARLLREAMAAVAAVDAELFGPDADPALRQIGDAVRVAFSQV